VAKERYSFLKTVIALVLIGLCLWAAEWQYQRGVDRHARNTVIAKQSVMAPVNLSEIKGDTRSFEWRTITLRGNFDEANQILLRSRYNEGVYGFEQLTLFAFDGRKIWVDRGWIKAGANASITPRLQDTTSEDIEITGRIRLDSSLPQGRFFAVANNSEKNLVAQLDARKGIQTENFYLDLISTSIPAMNPDAPAELPELSDGPHMAYALQWLFFAGLIIYGRRLIYKTA